MQIFMLFFLISSSWGIGVLHQQRPFSTFESISSTSFCSIDTIQAPNSCGASLYGKKERKNVSFNLSLKADGDAIDNGQKLLLDNIEQSTLRDIFEGDNFNSLTFDSRIEFNTPYFSIYYTPDFLLADSLLQNPSLPELSLFLAKKSEIGVVSSHDWPLFSIGGRLGYQTIKHSRSQFTLLELASTPSDDLIKFETLYSPSFDLSLSFWGTDYNQFLPYVTFQAKNQLSGFRLKETNFEGSEFLEPFTLFEKYYQLTLGRIFKTEVGTFKAGINGFFNEDMELYNDYILYGIGYDLNKFSVNTEYSEFKRSVGFIFKSRIVDIGLVYANEKELGKIQEEYTDSVFLSGNLHL